MSDADEWQKRRQQPGMYDDAERTQIVISGLSDIRQHEFESFELLDAQVTASMPILCADTIRNPVNRMGIRYEAIVRNEFDPKLGICALNPACAICFSPNGRHEILMSWFGEEMTQYNRDSKMIAAVAVTIAEVQPIGQQATGPNPQMWLLPLLCCTACRDVLKTELDERQAVGSLLIELQMRQKALNKMVEGITFGVRYPHEVEDVDDIDEAYSAVGTALPGNQTQMVIHTPRGVGVEPIDGTARPLKRMCLGTIESQMVESLCAVRQARAMYTEDMEAKDEEIHYLKEQITELKEEVESWRVKAKEDQQLFNGVTKAGKDFIDAISRLNKD